MIQDFENYNIGDSLWYCRVQLSAERRNFLHSKPPRKVTIEKISPTSLNYTIWTCKDEKGNTLTLDIYFKAGYYADNEFLFTTKEDATQYWNSVINNGIDWLDSQYQENVKRLKSRLLKV